MTVPALPLAAEVRVDSNQVMVVLGIVLIVFPIVLIAVLNRVFRKGGGITKGWGGVLFVCLCWIAAMWLVRSKIADFL